MVTDVVIIDSGINNRFKSRIAGGVNLSGVGETNDIQDNIGHGSSVFNLIAKHNSNISAFIIKICDNYNGFSFEKLCAALEFILATNIECRLINISMGITRLDDYSKLHNLIVSLTKKGIVIISSYNNYGLVSYPAGFEEVIGVDCSPACTKRDVFEYVEDSIINIRASSAYFHAFDSNERKILANGTSYATANLTGMILKNTKNYRGKNYYDYCLMFLKNNAAYIHSVEGNHHIYNKNGCSNDSSRKENEINLPNWNSSLFLGNKPKAVVFPFNKEIHSIARFESMLNIEVVGYYDHRISVNNNKIINEILNNECNNDSIVRSINDLDWDSNFELFVCGHCNEMQVLTNDDEFERIINKCIKYDKKLYSFDDPRSYLTEINNYKPNNFYYPYIDKSMVKQNRFDKLRKSSKPVIGVYGTSSKQGKHTLQLYLRKALIRRGYTVGELGTEPHGYLFGFDYIYPMGYNSSVSVDKHDAVRILNEAMWKIENKDPDIIITGCQSGTIPYNINVMSNLNFSCYEFIIGTAPDAVILCVNHFDSIEYIKKTINFIESVGNAKVISLVVFPFNTNLSPFSNNKIAINIEEINKKIDYLYLKTGIKTFFHDKMNSEHICDEIIKYFSNCC